VPLVYLPSSEALFAWGSDWDSGYIHVLTGGAAHRALLLTPDGLHEVGGQRFDLVQAVAQLSAAPAAALGALPNSFSIWALASKLAIDFVARERVAPTIARRDGKVEARWAAALSASQDSERVNLLARSMSPAAHAVPVAFHAEAEAWPADALLRAFLDATVDAFVRSTLGAPPSPRTPTWDRRWQAALSGPERAFEAKGFAERTLAADLERWSEPALGSRDRLRACFRLELPETDRAPFSLRFFLQSPDDPSMLVPAAEVWTAPGHSLARLGREFREPQESLLEALGRAARLFAPLGAALESAKPESLALDPAGAWAFLGEGAPLLAEAGFGVIVPGELTRAGQRRLRLRMRVGGKSSKVAGTVSGTAGLGLDELISVDWQAIIGDQALTARELGELAKHKAPLVRYRGAWTAIDPSELAEIQERMTRGPSRITVRRAVQVALAGESQDGVLSVAVTASGQFAQVLERLRTGGASAMPAPKALQATLRPYQERGLAWLSALSSLGLGACLADDMGLGKTIQLLAFLLRRVQENPADHRPTLLIAPTSVLGNWQREAERFAPSLPVVEHYGSERRLDSAALNAPGSLVLTSYGVLRRDAALLSRVDWAVVALDEAQNIKNAASATARAACSLRASQRFALTGTPVENRLAELWSILEFANPGLLGPLEIFRREFAVPIERYDNEQVAERLRRVVGPFILRRLKSDPTVISDLPAKNEANMVCTLTREQATLYKAVVDEELRRIEDSEGMERRGRVLALLTYTKQICNHPAQYLGESGPLPHRSGKLARLGEMLEEALSAGDKVLVFTQFREMGERLTAHFRATLEVNVQFLHGGTSKKARDEMVQRFQQDAHGPRVFVLSLKAGGTGLNLTAASHVFHYDRWWNPAVEDQATDRAYRIGQKRAVQVHKLLCAGTVEEKIDLLLSQKRKLAASIVGKGEHWITELDDTGLRDLFSLSRDAGVSDVGAEA
jgi:superfamily II DNA or RNA helicase